MVEWMTIVARACRTTGAPDPLPDADIARWAGRNVRVVVGDHDVFFPVDRLSAACRTRLNLSPVVIPRCGHLLVDEEPEMAVDVAADVM
jgi:pimeloyl-ACP methyl ester carboxylesterase